MNLQDIFTHLAHGELSQLFVGEDGEINASERPKIASSVTLGLGDLYKRLLIKESSESVVLNQGTSTYVLAATDVNNIERIVDSEGEEITLNDVNDVYSFRTISDTAFSLSDDYFTKKEITTETVTIYYRANHPELNAALVRTDPASVDIELPFTYVQALLFYVASRVHAPVGLTKEFHTGNDYLSKYEAEVARLQLHNIPSDRVAETTRFEAGGWV